MYGYKSMVLQNLAVFEKDRDKIHGILKVFGAYCHVRAYDVVYNRASVRKFLYEFDDINELVQEQRLHNDNELLVQVTKLIDLKMKNIHEFLDSENIRKAVRIDEILNSLDLAKVRGCSGTYLES